MTETTKLDKIKSLLSRKSGATIADLMKATGWRAGSVTGNIGKLRRRGLIVTKEATEKRGTVYHGTAPAA